jgi:hypothetical protein
MLERIRNVVTVALVVLAPAGAVRGAEPETYESPDGVFRFQMPGEPRLSYQQLPEGKLTLQMHDTPRGVLIVSYLKLPAEAAAESKEAMGKRLARAVEVLAKGVNGEVIDDKDSKFGEFPARTFRVSADKEGTPGIGRGKIVAAKGQLVQILVLGEPAWADEAEQSAFIRSFRLRE